MRQKDMSKVQRKRTRYRTMLVRCWPMAVATAITLAAALTPRVAATQAATGSAVSPAREQLQDGDRATTARQPQAALEHYELALQTEPRNYDALWKASNAAVDLGEAEGDAKKRDALYTRAADFSRRAVEVNPNGADGHFALARAIGRTALSMGARDRVKFAADVRTHALKALAINPRHAGALHIMGVWNAEVMRLNSLSRLFAKTVLGGQVLGTASWESAVHYIEQSVAADPTRTVHRLDEARIYRDAGRKADARAAYEAALKCPLADANDELYRRQATDELRALK